MTDSGVYDNAGYKGGQPAQPCANGTWSPGSFGVADLVAKTPETTIVMPKRFHTPSVGREGVPAPSKPLYRRSEVSIR